MLVVAVVDLHAHTCSYREWQVTGKPCLHALAFIQIEKNVDLESSVHEYYSVERFKIAYSGTIPIMADKSQWPKVNMGFKFLLPNLKTRPGRNRKNRFKASHEPVARKQQSCNSCGEYGQYDPNCELSDPKKRKALSKPKNRAVKLRTLPPDTISSRSVTRRMISLSQCQDITASVKRLLVLSQHEEATTSMA